MNRDEAKALAEQVLPAALTVASEYVGAPATDPEQLRVGEPTVIHQMTSSPADGVSVTRMPESTRRYYVVPVYVSDRLVGEFDMQWLDGRWESSGVYVPDTTEFVRSAESACEREVGQTVQERVLATTPRFGMVYLCDTGDHEAGVFFLVANPDWSAVEGTTVPTPGVVYVDQELRDVLMRGWL